MQTHVGLTKEKGKVFMDVDFEEEIDGQPYRAFVNVWVPDVDSRSELDKLAVREARKFLWRFLTAPDA